MCSEHIIYDRFAPIPQAYKAANREKSDFYSKTLGNFTLNIEKILIFKLYLAVSNCTCV